MKLIKKYLIVIVALFAAVLFTACAVSPEGGTKTNEPTATVHAFEVPEGGYDGSEVTVSFYHTMGANLSGVLNNYITEFNKLYPNITISHQQVGGYDDVRDQISKDITVGIQPNMAYCYPDHVALYNDVDAVQSLDDLIASTVVQKRYDGSESTEVLGLTQEQIDDFIPAYYEEGRQFEDGLMYTLPFSKSTEVLYYNKTFFEANNLSVPTTWDELEVLCARILELDPDCIPLGYDSEANWFITLCEQYESPYTTAKQKAHFLFVNDTNEAFIKRLRGWFQKGYITTQSIYGSYTSGLFVNVTPGEQKSYMSIGSSAGATHQCPTAVDGVYPFEVGIAPIPQVNPEKPKVISQGPSICIFAKENKQEVIASWLFLKFLVTNVNFQAEFSYVSGYVPVIKSVENNSYYRNNFLDKADGGDYIAALSAKVCLAQEAAYYTSPAFNGSSKARDEVGILLSNCISAKWSEQEVDQKIHQAFINALEACAYFQN